MERLTYRPKEPYISKLSGDLIEAYEVRKTRPKLETPFKCYIYCIKHTIYGWKFGMPCWLWGSRTKGEEKRSFGGYTQYPNNAEVYSLEEWQESGYGAGDVCKVDEPVQMCIGFCKKYKKYDTVLVPLDQYVKYCECACLPLDKPKGV